MCVAAVDTLRIKVKPLRLDVVRPELPVIFFFFITDEEKPNNNHALCTTGEHKRAQSACEWYYMIIIIVWLITIRCYDVDGAPRDARRRRVDRFERVARLPPAREFSRASPELWRGTNASESFALHRVASPPWVGRGDRCVGASEERFYFITDARRLARYRYCSGKVWVIGCGQKTKFDHFVFDSEVVVQSGLARRLRYFSRCIRM